MDLADSQVAGTMYLVAFISFTGAWKAIYAGWAMQEPVGKFSKIISTQRRRYTFVALGQSTLASCGVWLLVIAPSVESIVAGTKAWFAFGVHGWLVGLSVILIATSPLISAAALISIYRRPTLLAYKRFYHNLYCTTESHRAGKPEFRVASGRANGDGTTETIFIPAV